MNNKKLKSFVLYVRSMKFGICLLLLIVLLAIIGSVIPQGLEEKFYESKYNTTIANIIITLQFHKLYDSALFLIVFTALSVNLVMCSITRIGQIRKRIQRAPAVDHMSLIKTYHIENTKDEEIQNTLKEISKTMGFGEYRRTDSNNYYAVKYKVGYLGSWILHLGILFIIVFYSYGHSTFFSEAIYGVSGTVEAIKGTNYKARLEDFNVEFREDGSVRQYTSIVELLDPEGNTLKASTVSVNKPMRYKGYTFYQTAYGWAANCIIKKTGETILEETIYERTAKQIESEHIAIYFNRFYPDFASTRQGFISLSDQLKNPALLFMLVYHGDVVMMDLIKPGEVSLWNDYEIILENPQRYTYLDVNRMKGHAGAIIGSIFILVGLLLVFYFKPIKLLMSMEGDRLYIYSEEKIAQKYKFEAT